MKRKHKNVIESFEYFELLGSLCFINEFCEVIIIYLQYGTAKSIIWIRARQSRNFKWLELILCLFWE